MGVVKHALKHCNLMVQSIYIHRDKNSVTYTHFQQHEIQCEIMLTFLEREHLSNVIRAQARQGLTQLAVAGTGGNRVGGARSEVGGARSEVGRARGA